MEDDIITEEDLKNQPPVVYPEDPNCYNRWGHRESPTQRINGTLWCVDCATDFGLIQPTPEEPTDPVPEEATDPTPEGPSEDETETSP